MTTPQRPERWGGLNAYLADEADAYMDRLERENAALLDLLHDVANAATVESDPHVIERVNAAIAARTPEATNDD